MDFIHRFHPRCELYGKYKSRGFEAAIEVAHSVSCAASALTRCWPSLATSLVDKSRAATLKWRRWNEKKLSRTTEDNISYQKETKNAKNWGRRKTLKETAKENSALFWEVRAGCQAFAQDKCLDTFPLFSKIDVNGENEVVKYHVIIMQLSCNTGMM